MQRIHDIPVWGEPLYNAVEQMQHLIAPDAERVALMADHHLGYSMPIGGVAAYKDKISPSGVGFDIACGNKAVKLDLSPQQVEWTVRHIGDVMDEIWNTISFGMGQKNGEKVDLSYSNRLTDSRHADAWRIVGEISKSIGKGRYGLTDIAAQQLGTVGGGNHYVDLFLDDDNQIWIGVHFGSRGLGHKIASYFIKEGGGQDQIHAKPVLLDVTSELGQKYLACMMLAGDYAYAGRDWVCDRVARILGGSIVDEVHNHHNYAWQEIHSVPGGEEWMLQTLWVVRKGATPAFPGQLGFIGGSMGESAVIVKGVDSELSRIALNSTVHGAGRAMSRTEARGKVHRKTGEVKKAGKVTRDDMMGWIEKAGVCLRGADVDEAPQCYKRLGDVLAAHAGTIEIVHNLHPIGVAMAGPDIKDPYKD